LFYHKYVVAETRTIHVNNPDQQKPNRRQKQQSRTQFSAGRSGSLLGRLKIAGGPEAIRRRRSPREALKLLSVNRRAGFGIVGVVARWLFIRRAEDRERRWLATNNTTAAMVMARFAFILAMMPFIQFIRHR
jgi:hypothetical protein